MAIYRHRTKEMEYPVADISTGSERSKRSPLRIDIAKYRWYAVEGDKSGFWFNVMMILLLVLSQVAMRAVIRWLEKLSRSSLENLFKQRLLDNILTRDFGTVSAVHSGEWLNRLTNDTVVVANNSVEILPGLSGMIVKMVSAMVMMIFLDRRFALVLLPVGIVLFSLPTASARCWKGFTRIYRSVTASFVYSFRNASAVWWWYVPLQRKNRPKQRLLKRWASISSPAWNVPASPTSVILASMQACRESVLTIRLCGLNPQMSVQKSKIITSSILFWLPDIKENWNKPNHCVLKGKTILILIKNAILLWDIALNIIPSIWYSVDRI